MAHTFRHIAQAKQRRANREWRANFRAGNYTRYRGNNYPRPPKVKHASDLRFCGCRMCSHGLHTPYNSEFVRQVRGGARAKVRDALRTGNYDAICNRIAVPYTD